MRDVWNRILCRVLGHIPVRLSPDKERCLRILPGRRCKRCGRYACEWDS